ncbi:G-type lectin S-receptor serine/threonine-protein kinase [Spatholobus suberectus]|nr:G-type lectin S-receptor serine/threonine-protein kinase [Spatholobus suberectus]
MRSEVLFSLSLLLSWVLCFQLCFAADTLKAGEKITQDSAGNLVSSNLTFELGFFPLPTESDSRSQKRYLGIWYYGLEPRTVVWVANRDKPVLDSGGVFRIAEDGNLVVEGASKKSHWSSELEGSSSSTNRTVKLLDSGNLVLMDDNLGASYLWQSFQNPTDTFLPGMKMDPRLTLTSWKDATDPARGSFTFKLDQGAEGRRFVVQNQSQIYWALDELDPEGISPVIFNLLDNTTWGNLSYNISNKTVFIVAGYSYEKSRLLMNYSGEMQFRRWNEDGWDTQLLGPGDKCDIRDYCGSFGICNRHNWIRCKCLPGFSPSPGHNQYEGEFQLRGCVRKSPSCIDTDVKFLNLTNIKLGDPDQQMSTETEAECRSSCLTMCPDYQCQAYSYNTSTYGDRDSFTCKIWTRPLPTLVEEYDRGLDLSILVKRSDIEPTAKSCEPCGTYIIPYPLSTGPNCGDPMYNKFNCNKSTGHVSFMMPGGKSYQVTSIDEGGRMFFIQTYDSNWCSSSSSYQNGIDFPFDVTECIKDVGIKINWLPAPEPPCSNLIDCKNYWPHSTCTAKLEEKEEEPSRNHSIHRLALILTVILMGMAILAGTIAFVIVRKKKTVHKLDRASTRVQESLYESERHVKGLIGLGSLEEKDIEGIEVPCYSYASILAATDNFSDSNKLGRGGYGPVYKVIGSVHLTLLTTWH